MTDYYERPWDLDPIAGLSQRMRFCGGVLAGILLGLLPVGLILSFS